MNELKIFENKEFGKVRMVLIDGTPYFVGKDVAEILGYKNPNEAIQDHVDEDDKFLRSTRGSEMLKLFSTVKDIQNKFGRQDNWFINESGIYSLVFSSKLPTAKKFKRWVTSEVLPSIRKTGAYSLSIPSYQISNPIERAKKWIEEEEVRQELQKQNELMKPKADFYDTVANSESYLSMNDTAKILNMGIGRNKLLKFLREKKILMKDNIPYQEYIDRGYFKVIEGKYMVGDNAVISRTTYVKQKGVDYIRKRLKGDVLNVN